MKLFVPGRICLFGEHSLGRWLPAHLLEIEKGIR